MAFACTCLRQIVQTKLTHVNTYRTFFSCPLRIVYPVTSTASTHCTFLEGSRCQSCIRLDDNLLFCKTRWGSAPNHRVQNIILSHKGFSANGIISQKIFQSSTGGGCLWAWLACALNQDTVKGEASRTGTRRVQSRLRSVSLASEHIQTHPIMSLDVALHHSVVAKGGHHEPSLVTIRNRSIQYSQGL
jgi:hypothetical protein